MTMAPGTRNSRSKASIAGHPIHPMLISFPIAFFIMVYRRQVAVSDAP
jgi:uncharacterized membrane protein